MMSGIIYRITNTINGKIYIGQTTKTLSLRWSQHVSDSKKKKTPLYKAMRKYGVSSFVVEQIYSATCLNLMERYFIATNNSLVPNGYNCTSGGNLNMVMSAETRKKMSEAKRNLSPWNKGKKTGKMLNPGSRQKTLKAVIRTDSSGETKIYPSVKSVSEDGFSPSIVSLCCSYPSTYKTHKEFIWKFQNPKFIKEISPKIKKINHTKFKNGLIPFNSKKVKVTDLTTYNVTIFDSTTIAAKALGYKNYNTVSQYCKKEKTANNLKFEYLG